MGDETPKTVLKVAAGILIGLVVVALLIGLTTPPFDHSVNPQSLEGIERALIACALALLAGAGMGFLPSPLSTAALRTVAGLMGAYGLLVIALSQNYFGFVYGLVMAPAAVLGAAAAQNLKARRG